MNIIVLGGFCKEPTQSYGKSNKDMGFLIMSLIILTLSPSSSSYSCIDENNNPVDWFTIYKIPKLKDSSNSLIREGVAFAYTSSENDEGWFLSGKSINDTNSIPGLTLASFYKASSNTVFKDTLYIFYNDQPPNGDVSFTGGHTKGVVVANESGGFWMVHSVPHYPPPPESSTYGYPHTGLKNGQSYLCITLKPEQLEIVGTQLMYNDPKIFANSTPSQLKKLYPTLTKAAMGSNISSPPHYHSEIITSAKGIVFSTFAKSPEFHKDLYSDWVAASLQVSLFVETWPNGAGRLNSSCDQTYRVENIEGVNMSVVGEAFPSTKDHSKWAVSETKDQPWVCIGDINRATTQAVRGGGTVCVKDPQLWGAYFSSISQVQDCHRPFVTLI